MKGVNENEEEKIVRELKRSGYPLEIKTTFMLESSGWNVLNQEGYLDIETNKWRTIDIVATRAVELSGSPAYERLHLLLAIECKKIDKPWVFWTMDKKLLRIFYPLAAYGLIKLESKPWLHPLQLEKLAKCFHYYSPKFSKVAIISYEPFLGKGKSIIFEAKHQVIKFLLYEREKIRNFLSMVEARERIKLQSKTISNLISIAYPVIVVDGKLYEMEFEDEEPKLSELNYLQYLTSFGTPSPEHFVIDVVKINFLKEYLDIIEEEIKQLTEKIISIQSPSQTPTSTT